MSLHLPTERVRLGCTSERSLLGRRTWHSPCFDAISIALWHRRIEFASVAATSQLRSTFTIIRVCILFIHRGLKTGYSSGISRNVLLLLFSTSFDISSPPISDPFWILLVAFPGRASCFSHRTSCSANTPLGFEVKLKSSRIFCNGQCGACTHAIHNISSRIRRSSRCSCSTAGPAEGELGG